jgi:Family of unknown function (DUF5519)
MAIAWSISPFLSPSAISSGQAEPHHILPNSGWISYFLRTEADVDHAIELMRTSFDLATAKRQVKGLP